MLKKLRIAARAIINNKDPILFTRDKQTFFLVSQKWLKGRRKSAKLLNKPLKKN